MQRQKLKVEGDDSDSGGSLIDYIAQKNKQKAALTGANSVGISIISKPEDLEKYMREKGSKKEKAKESDDDCDSQKTKSLQKCHEVVRERLKQFDQRSSSLAEQQKQTVPVRQAEKVQQARPSIFQKQLAKIEYKQKMKAAKDKYQQFKQQRESNSIYIIDKKLTAGQKQLKIRDTTVYFPYEPYEVQVEYMKCVLQALDYKTNALLQSPTGTGKTLCLLASVLSFVEKVYKTEKIKHNVIYMSRTHSQLKQVQKELEKTCYRPNMAIFASRDQLCLKENLSMLKGKEKIQACGKGVKLARKMKKISSNSEQDPKLMEAACFYHRQREEVLGIARRKLANTLLDIDKMKEYGLQQKFCPYFYPIQTKEFTNLFIMPYNYLLDAYLLSNYQQIIENSIIIFDEAHNVAEAACEGRSLLLDSHNFDAALMELNKILSQFTSPSLQSVRQQFQKQIKFLVNKIEDFKQNFGAFVKTLFNVKENRFQRDSGRYQQAEVKVIYKERTDFSIYELFCGSVSDERRKEFEQRKDYFKSTMTSKLLNPMEEFVSYGSLLIEELKETSDGVFNNFQRVLIFCMKVKKLVSVKLFVNVEKQIDYELSHHRLHINRGSQSMGFGDSYSVGLKCLVPWLTFQDIVRFRPRSILLTSGTLNPLNMWEKELRVKFPCQLLNQHVIKPTQILGNIIKSGPLKTRFTFTFDNLSKNRIQIFRDLIEFLIQACSKIPNGVLLVFPSFKLQMDFKFQLMKSSKKERLSECKEIIFEQKSTDINMNEFKRKALSRKGAILVSICRGKVSQGIDFPDGMCRAVFMVGLPYPNIKDPFIIEKKNHLEFMANRSPDKSLSLTGEEWYFMGTIRAINQALGRVIRHAKDYGMIYLLDTRYSDSKIQKQLPQWIIKSTRVVESLQSSFFNEIQSFYLGMMKEYPTKEGQKLSVSPKQQKVQTNALQVLMKNRKRLDLKKMSIDFLLF